MEQQQVTLFIVGNRSGKTKKIVIPATWAKIGGFVAAVVLVAFVAGLVDYFGLLIESIENKRLRAENAELVKQFQVVESKVNALENSLERVKTFTQKLRLITNIQDQDRVVQLTMGPKPAAGSAPEEYEPMDQRMGPEDLAKQDQVFPPKAQANEQMGELAAEPAVRDYASLVIRIDQAVRETQLKEQSVLELWEGLSDRQSLLNATPNIKPARGWITSHFGRRVNPVTGKLAMHMGLDIAAAPGSPVYAPADGVVTFASFDESYGKLVSIDHGYGVTTRFGHNSQIYVHAGQKVNKYDVIAAVGSTGRSTGPHLHYEVRINGTPIDPANYILDE